MIPMISIIAISTIPSLPVILSLLLVNWPGMCSSLVPGSTGVAGATAIDPLPPAARLSLSDYHLVWSDDFDGEELDRRKWYPLIDCSGRGNNELQCYTGRQENVRVQNGQLELIAHAENYGGRNFTSGRTHASGPGWTYGWFEVRARLAKGMHLWPAIWLVPTDRAYGPWPRSGEIDMIEARGQNVFQLESTIHFGSSRSDRGKIGSSMIDFPFDFSEEFHIFGFEWTNQSMRWFLDGIQYFETSTNRYFTDKKGEKIYPKKGAPFDQNFKWVFNVAVGGFFFPDSVYGRISRSDALAWPKPVMEVDWVRVFQKKTGSRDQPHSDPPISDPAGTPVTTPTPTSTTSHSSTSLSSLRLATETATGLEETTTATHPSTTVMTTTTTATTTTTTRTTEAPHTSRVPGGGEEEGDKKSGDRQVEGKDKGAKKEADKAKDSEILNEKKMNEVVSDPDNTDDDYDIISAEDQRANPLNNDYYGYS